MKQQTRQNKHLLKPLALAISLSLLTACGGGGTEKLTNNGNIGSGEGGIIGTAKIIVKSSDVKAKSKNGNSFRASIGNAGSFKFAKLKPGSYLLRTQSGADTLYSVAQVEKGKTTRSNVHPITDLIIRNWFAREGLDIDAQFKGSTPISKLPSVAEINKIETAIEGILKQLLKESGVSGPVDLIGNQFAAKTGDSFNTFLENNKVVINNQQITLLFTNNKFQTVSINGKPLNTNFVDDTQNPTTPSSLRALPSGTQEIVVVWEPSTDDKGVAGYNVYRNGQLVATTPYPVYTDKGLSANTQYDYMVEAVDGTGKKSAKANSQVVMTLTSVDTTPPPAVTGLEVNVVSDDIKLNWNITQVDDIAQFSIKRGKSGMAKTELARITANTFTDFNLPDGNYCYTVSAIDAAGNKSAESSEQCGLISSGSTPPVGTSCTSYQTLQTTNIDQDTTINAGCYRVTSSIKVKNPAKLTIKPGATLSFAASTQLEVGEGASLNAVGTAANPIIFTGREKTPGFWKGIQFYRSNSINNQLEHVTVEYGEKNIDNVSFSSSPARFSIKNSTIRFASDVGVYIYDESVKLDAFENNTLTGNGRPITLPADMVGKLGKDSSYSGNTDDRLHVWDSDLVTPQTWENLGIPYYLRNSSTYNIKAGLTIEAGTTLIFNSDALLEIDTGGSLNAVGTNLKPILFTGQEKTAGYWNGIQFYRSNSNKNILDHVTIEYGVKNIDSFSFSSDPARFSIKNTVSQYASELGLNIYSESVRIDTFVNNTFKNNQVPVKIPSNLVGKLGTDSTYTGNTDDRIFVFNSDISTTQTWKKLDAPYYLSSGSTYTINAGLTIEAGSSLTFYAGSGLEVVSGGSLKAIGTDTESITFKGLENSQGYWDGIEFDRSNSSNNKLDHVIVQDAGAGDPNTSGNISSFCFSSDPTRFTISNSTIRNSASWGVYRYGTANHGCYITLINNSYSNNLSGDVSPPEND